MKRSNKPNRKTKNSHVALNGIRLGFYKYGNIVFGLKFKLFLNNSNNLKLENYSDNQKINKNLNF